MPGYISSHHVLLLLNSSPTPSMPAPPPSISHFNHGSLSLVPPVQSLLHMNVPHLHSEPFSFAPDGPSGLTHIQNSLPQLKPGFLVFMVLHGSSCSQRGAMGLLKSLDQEFLEAMGSTNVVGLGGAVYSSSGMRVEGSRGTAVLGGDVALVSGGSVSAAPDIAAAGNGVVAVFVG